MSVDPRVLMVISFIIGVNIGLLKAEIDLQKKNSHVFFIFFRSFSYAMLITFFSFFIFMYFNDIHFVFLSIVITLVLCATVT